MSDNEMFQGETDENIGYVDVNAVFNDSVSSDVADSAYSGTTGTNNAQSGRSRQSNTGTSVVEGFFHMIRTLRRRL